jgi:DNA-binding MarR family transcriptional regulator
MAKVKSSPVAAFRRFNRFYTRHVGALDEGYHHSRFTLAEARVLYELGTRDVANATAIREELSLDAGYLSRILRGFSAAGLISRKRASKDRRQVVLTLTAKGRRAFLELDTKSNERAREVLDTLGPSVTLGEIVKGTHLLAHSQRRRQLEAWCEDLIASFAGRILPVDELVAKTWGEFYAKHQRAGRTLPSFDSLLAATAIAHKLTLATHNAADFPSDVPVVDPWQ